MDNKQNRFRRRLFRIIEVGSDYDLVSRGYDYLNAALIVINLIVSILYTYDGLRMQYGSVLVIVEKITIGFFAIDYALRIWTARFLYPELKEWHAIRKYTVSFTGMVDLLSFLPYFLPIFFPAGTAAFRLLRIVRIFRLFRINAYHDSLSVITSVINGKRQQLMSSVFIILVLMIASSLCMYSLEHEAQPEVFSNAFSGIWWATSTLLTVGYGDIYPITLMGKIFGIFISFLGVGMVAIPTGIISAGFVDQYSIIKQKSEYGYETKMRFIKVFLGPNDKWIGKRVADLDLPEGIIVAIIKRKEDAIIPRGDVVLCEEDSVVLGAEPFDDHEMIVLKEVVLRKNHPWVNMCIEELDISRHSVIVLVKRKNKAMIPNGKTKLRSGDNVFVYTQKHFLKANEIQL